MVRDQGRERCGMSPDLFNLIMEIVVILAKKEGSDTGVKLNCKPLDNLRFADDIDLLADTKESLQDLMNRVGENSKTMGLEINADKTKQWQ